MLLVCNALAISYEHYASRLFCSKLSDFNGGFILIISVNIIASYRPIILSGKERCYIFNNSTDFVAQRIKFGPLSINSYFLVVRVTLELNIPIFFSD